MRCTALGTLLERHSGQARQGLDGGLDGFEIISVEQGYPEKEVGWGVIKIVDGD